MSVVVSLALPVAITVLLLIISLVLFLNMMKSFVKFFNYIFKVNPDCRRNGGEVVAEVLKAHHVNFVFTLCGGHISPILVASEQRGIRVVDTRHEATSVFAADAVARLSQKIGVACVTAGPGVTNTVTAMKNAQMAASPILLIGGAAAGLSKGRGALQDIDQLSLFRPICKYVASVTRVSNIAPTLRHAIRIAQSGTPGPVFVEFPIDVLYPYDIVRRELGIIQEPKSFKQKLTNCYLEFYLARLFGGNNDTLFEIASTKPLPLSIPLAKENDVQRCVRLLAKSQRPVMLIGSQTMLPPVDPLQLQRAVEAIGIPCYLGGMSRGLLGRRHRLALRQERKTALKEADLVILAGTVCDFRLSYGRVLNRRSAVVAVNRSREQLYKNSDAFWTPTLAIQADAGDFLVRLSRALDSTGTGYNGASESWLNTLRQRDQAKEDDNQRASSKPTEAHLNPLHVLHVLEENLSDDAILVADGGDFVGSAGYILRFFCCVVGCFLLDIPPADHGNAKRGHAFGPCCLEELWWLLLEGTLFYPHSYEYIWPPALHQVIFFRPRAPLSWLDPGAFGTLGVGAGFALGAKLCNPTKPVWVIFGDGSLGYSLVEFDTFVRHKLPIVAVVGTDGCWSQIAREQVPMFGSDVACQLQYTRYDKAVEAFGATGVLLSRENEGRLKNEFQGVRQTNERDGKTVLVNAFIGKSSFREGSISV